MRKRFAKAGNIILVLLCIGVCFGCASGRQTEKTLKEQEVTQSSSLSEEEQDIENRTTEESNVQESADQGNGAEAYFHDEQRSENEEQFYEYAKEQGVDERTAEAYLQILADDNIFQNGAMALTGLLVDDIDGNGQLDMLVMVLDAKEKPFYGSGSLWIYINDDEPYCFSEEECSYYGWFYAFWEDLDNDGNVEIVFSAQGTGCGAAGDSYKAVYKYKDHTIEQLQLPSDYEWDYDRGFNVIVFQEPEADSYSAYCPWFGERIDFHAENIEEWDLPGTAQVVGGNARGFFDLRAVEYEGKKVLQASEYLSGEGGIVHNVGIAQFLITWEEDGTPKVLKWWIEDWQ